METAEKLAKFVAQVGPEIEQFSIENSTDNPDLWYVPWTPTPHSHTLSRQDGFLWGSLHLDQGSLALFSIAPQTETGYTNNIWACASQVV